MKKLNKKGFTLIELLAVIIILGILMIIAIPSVTSYIQNSRKSAYADTAVQYADAVIKEVNGGKNLKLYSTNTLYLIPVGHDKTKSCVTLESGGQSPFDDEWRYAFVGVTYDGKGYNYYFISEDGAGQGISFLDKETLTKDGTDYIYSAHGDSLGATAAKAENITDDFASELKAKYGITTNATLTGDGTDGIVGGYSSVIVNEVTAKEGTDKTISKIVIIGTSCTHKETI